jgi:hypothetical protein
MDELTIDGKVYVSSKRAAALSGYAKDYVGQLCREGRVESKLVGRSWYVYEQSIRDHRFNDEKSKGKGTEVQSLNEEGNTIQSSTETSENTNIQAVWERSAYSSESFQPIPVLSEFADEIPTSREESEDPKTLADMQSAWQEWFAGRGVPATQSKESADEEVITSVPAEDASYQDEQEPEQVPVRMIVSDIGPKKAPLVEEKPLLREYRVKEVQRYTEQPRVATYKKAQVRSPLIVKALLVALILVSTSLTLIATGFIEELHIGGVENSAVFQYFQGSTQVK